LARDLTDFLLLFSSYPGSIYSGATKLIALTVLPAGFVVLAPVELLREPTSAHLAIAAAAALGYASLRAQQPFSVKRIFFCQQLCPQAARCPTPALDRGIICGRTIPNS
jgi:hypothetical protein